MIDEILMLKVLVLNYGKQAVMYLFEVTGHFATLLLPYFLVTSAERIISLHYREIPNDTLGAKTALVREIEI